jgi:hypothetical protein
MEHLLAGDIKRPGRLNARTASGGRPGTQLLQKRSTGNRRRANCFGDCTLLGRLPIIEIEN